MSTWSGSNGGITIQGVTTEPMRTPSGLLVTRAVETQLGWVGQIIIDKVIVWESAPCDPDEDKTGERKALKEANERVIARLRKIFS
jgi:hypothetical protein